MSNVTDQDNEQDRQSVIAEFATHMREVKRRKEEASGPELTAALVTVTKAIREHTSTGGGRRLRQFVWSLWNDFHMVNLYDLCGGLDSTLGQAVLVILRAKLTDALTERDHLEPLMRESGELARWEAARAVTPEDEEVNYPGIPMGAGLLHDLARSVVAQERREEERRRKEVA